MTNRKGGEGMSLKREDKRKIALVSAIILLIFGLVFTISGSITTLSGNTGEFKGVYTFEDDTNGQAPAGFTLNEGIGEKYTVVSQYSAQYAYKNILTHTKVLELQHTRFMQQGYVQGTFVTPPTGDNNFFEFWICNPGSCGDNQEIDLWLVNSTGGYRMWLQFDCQDIALWHSGGATTLHEQYTRDMWHHFRLQLNMMGNNYTLYRDETFVIGTTYNFANSGDITNFRFATAPWYDNPNDGTYKVYVDAVGYSWHSDYFKGDNLTLIEPDAIVSASNEGLLFIGIAFIVLGLIGLEGTLLFFRIGKSQRSMVVNVQARPSQVPEQPFQPAEGSSHIIKRGNLNYCPYCGATISTDVISKYKAGESVRCPWCSSEIS